MMIINKNLLVKQYLDELFPKARCELFYNKPYELVIAVMLSAQTTDKAVNNVTSILFKKYNSINALAYADIKEVENIIKPIGMAKTKANRVKEICKKLISDFSGEVPNNKELLMTLPGVGNKTAGVILAEIYKIPELPVDTHISRIAKRLQYCDKKDDALTIESKLKKEFKKEDWIDLHHQLIHFGRYFCTARKPNCKECKIKAFCIENDAYLR